MLLTLSLLWGASFFLIEVILTELPPFTVVLLRIAIAAVVLWGVVFMLGHRPPREPGVWLVFATLGLLNNLLPFSLITWGQTQIASGLASILNATTPLFTVVVAGLLLTDERITLTKVAGSLTGFAGVAIMLGPSVVTGMDTNLIAQIAVLGAALAYALAGVYGRRIKSLGVNPVVAAAGQVTASSLMLAPIAGYVERPLSLSLPELETVLAILCLAIFSTALAYILYFRILASSGATNLLLVTFLIPVSAILLGVLLLEEVLERQHIIGMGFISIGLGVIDGRIWRWFKTSVSRLSRP